MQSERLLFTRRVTSVIKVVEILLTKMSKEAINAQTKSPNKRTALHNAAKNGDTMMVKMLIPAIERETIDAIDGAGWTALMHAARNGNTEIVRILLPKMSQGAIDMTDESKVTALHLSGREGNIEIVQMILSKMSHNVITLKNMFGRSIFDYPGMGSLTYVDSHGETRFTG